jgi:hypothetical protein
MPLIAVASIVAVAVGAVVVTKVVADRDHAIPPTHHKTDQAKPPPLKPPVVPHFRANSVSFTDAQHGWALGDSKCASSRHITCPALLATDDGGTSWRVVSTPKGLVSTFDEGSCGTNGGVRGPCVDSVVFANASVGYLWSLHDIYSTTDGGRHWSHYVDPAHDWDGASRLVVVGASVVRIAPIHQCSSGCAGSVQTAPIGTTRWRPSPPPTADEVGLYSSNLSVSGAQVYLFAGLTAANPGAGVYHSADGGHTWQLVSAHPCGVARNPENDPFRGESSRAADNGALIVYCANGIRVAAPGSDSFTATRRFPGEQIDLDAARTQNRVVVSDVSHQYAPGAISTTFYVTSDGGVTWHRTATVPVLGGTARFTPGGHGYAITPDGGSLYTTDDGGHTWHRIEFGA